MKKQTLVIAMMMFGVAAIACSKKEEASGGGGNSIGVAECDEYIAKYQKCIDKMPAAAKSTAEQGFKAQVDAWKTSAATPQGKAALKTGCKATLDALATNPLCK
ncbi:MAG: hypothetical protein JST00_05910 [Deltaproteobacteria bacterium]|nr:hypothetical protein [Deltaproteobacteria bacterium]